MKARNINVVIEYDVGTGDHYIIWEPIVIGAGKTKSEALEDLRTAAHFGTDALINNVLINIKKGG